MAGGYIFEKDPITANVQGNKDKSLIIDPNYAYQVPFQFNSDWEDIKIGMFVSYVLTGDGVDANNNAINGNSGLSDTTFYSAGGTSLDTFNYIGIMKTGVASDDPSLPLTSVNSGFLGLKGDKLYVRDNTNVYFNKIYNSATSSDTQGDARFIATNGTTMLEDKPFLDSQGNFNIVSLRASEAEAGEGSPENPILFCDYWGLRFQVYNKDDESNQRIRVTASINGTQASDNIVNSYHAISDPSMNALKLLMNGVGEYQYTSSTANMHGTLSTYLSTKGFVWNNGSTAYALPDSLFFYNAFSNIRPRIHAWAVKKIS